MVGSDGARLGAVVDRGVVADRIATRTAPLAVPATAPDRAPGPAPPATGVLTAEVCWGQVGAAGHDVPRLAVAAFALTVTARTTGGPVHLGLLRGADLLVVGDADRLRLPALAAALEAAPPGAGATVTLTAGGTGVSSVPPTDGAGWAVLTVGEPAMRPRATALPGGDWGVGVALLGTLTLTYRSRAGSDAAALLARVVDELEHRNWRDER